MEVEQLIKKFGLKLNKATSERNNDERYTWDPESAHRVGDIMGVNIKEYDTVVFAQNIYFKKEDLLSPPRILCYGWEQIEPDNYEHKLNELFEKYNQAVKEFKEYAVSCKIKQLNKDF